jgi:acetoin utilization protein AcuC
MSQPSTIGGINLLSDEQKRAIYCGLIPRELIERFHLSPSFVDEQGQSLIKAKWAPGNPSAEISLFHKVGFPDPILYGHLTDTMNGQIHILLYILNDPDAPRFDVDKMPDGRATKFGTLVRNLEAEKAALEAGLAPGQVRHGLRLLHPAVIAFENFVEDLGHDMYFVEPLYYHNAVIFERYGFAYQQGKKLMERIHNGFSEGGNLLKQLDGSAFRPLEAQSRIRLRSWAIHDGILGEPFTNVTMYKRVGKSAGISTTADAKW